MSPHEKKEQCPKLKFCGFEKILKTPYWIFALGTKKIEKENYNR